MRIDRIEWTPERIEKLTMLWNQGLSSARIGQALGITKNAAIGKIHRLKLTARQSPIKRMKSKPRAPKIVQPKITSTPSIAAPAATEVEKASSEPKKSTKKQEISNKIQILTSHGPLERFDGAKLSKEPCQYPMWQNRKDVGRLYCKKPCLEGKTYCPQHNAMCHTTSRASANLRASTG